MKKNMSRHRGIQPMAGKKLIGGIAIVSILLVLPLSTFAYSIDDAKKDYKQATSEIMAKFQKITNLNVTGKIVNKKGVLKLADKVNIKKRLRLYTNLDVRGKILNKDKGEAVAINDDLSVTGNLDSLNYSTTSDIASVDTSGLTGGEIYYDTTSNIPYVWNATTWVDLSQQNTNSTYTAGTGINLASGVFTVNQGFSPTWSGNHTFSNDITAESSLLAGSSTYGDGTITQATGGSLSIALGGASGDDFIVDTNTLFVESDSDQVGIGTDNPGQKFEVVDSAANIFTAKIQNTHADGYGLTISTGDNANTKDALEISSAAGDLFTLTNSGNIKLGYLDVYDPYTKLDINGTMKLAPQDAEPYTCGANYDGALAATSIGTLCICDGSVTVAWEEVSNPASPCSWQ